MCGWSLPYPFSKSTMESFWWQETECPNHALRNLKKLRLALFRRIKFSFLTTLIFSV